MDRLIKYMNEDNDNINDKLYFAIGWLKNEKKNGDVNYSTSDVLNLLNAILDPEDY